jgi:hypothetical protein
VIPCAGTENGDEDGSQSWVFGSGSRRFGGQVSRRKAYRLMYGWRMAGMFSPKASFILGQGI